MDRFSFNCLTISILTHFWYAACQKCLPNTRVQKSFSLRTPLWFSLKGKWVVLFLSICQLLQFRTVPRKQAPCTWRLCQLKGALPAPSTRPHSGSEAAGEAVGDGRPETGRLSSTCLCELGQWRSVVGKTEDSFGCRGDVKLLSNQVATLFAFYFNRKLLLKLQYLNCQTM